MRREPLPIVVTSAFLILHPAFKEPYGLPDLLEGRLTETVKGVNAFWRVLAAIFIFLLCLELFPDPRVATITAMTCTVVSKSFFFSRSDVVNRLYTELPEVALMLLASWSAVRFVRHKTNARAFWLGAFRPACPLQGIFPLCWSSFRRLTPRDGSSCNADIAGKTCIKSLPLDLCRDCHRNDRNHSALDGSQRSRISQSTNCFGN